MWVFFTPNAVFQPERYSQNSFLDLNGEYSVAKNRFLTNSAVMLAAV